jgi:hypothetical protein
MVFSIDGLLNERSEELLSIELDVILCFNEIKFRIFVQNLIVIATMRFLIFNFRSSPHIGRVWSQELREEL